MWLSFFIFVFVSIFFPCGLWPGYGSLPPLTALHHHTHWTQTHKHTQSVRLLCTSEHPWHTDLYLTTHNTHNKQISMSPSGIRIHNTRKRAAADPLLRLCGHWDRLWLYVPYLTLFLLPSACLTVRHRPLVNGSLIFVKNFNKENELNWITARNQGSSVLVVTWTRVENRRIKSWIPGKNQWFSLFLNFMVSMASCPTSRAITVWDKTDQNVQLTAHLHVALRITTSADTATLSHMNSWRGDWLTLILLRWTIWRAPTNASKWRMGFNSAFKGLSIQTNHTRVSQMKTLNL